MSTPSSTRSRTCALAVALLACGACLPIVQASQQDPHPPEDGVPSWFEGKQPLSSPLAPATLQRFSFTTSKAAAFPQTAGWYIRLMPELPADEEPAGVGGEADGRGQGGGVSSLSLIIGSQPNGLPSWDKALMSLTVLNSRWVLHHQKLLEEAHLAGPLPDAHAAWQGACLLSFPSVPAVRSWPRSAPPSFTPSRLHSNSGQSFSPLHLAASLNRPLQPTPAGACLWASPALAAPQPRLPQTSPRRLTLPLPPPMAACCSTWMATAAGCTPTLGATRRLQLRTRAIQRRGQWRPAGPTPS